MSSYGIDFDGQRHLIELIRAVHEIEGIRRIRLGSLEPGIVTEEFAEALASMPKICPHFHLSLQSGCDAVLKRMNRKYTSGEYYEKCRILRKYFDAPALTTDVIVVFRERRKRSFRNPMILWTRWIFMRPIYLSTQNERGQRAASMPDQVDEQIKAQRSARLIELGEKKRKAYEKKFIGRTV